MGRFGRLLRALALASLLSTAIGCQAIFGDFRIDDNAFAGTQSGPILLNPFKGLYTTEWGGQATFTIVLDHQPSANVTVGLSSSNTSEGVVSPASVTFNKDDWRAPQVVTVTGVDDSRPDPNHAYKIVTAPATSDDPTFNGKNPIDIELINVDNETAGLTVVPRDGLETSESGGQDTFTVVLNSPPTKNVIVHLSSDTPTEGTVSPDNLVFTPLNWMAPQLVTVTGVDDDVKDPDHHYKISVTSTSDDQNYARLMPITVDVKNQDNETPGLTVVLVDGIDPLNSSKLRTSESGDTAIFTVALSAPPSADVVVPIVSDSLGEGTVSPESLTFTADNWNAPQRVTVTGVDDDGTADGDQPYVIALGPPTGDDPDYPLIPVKEVLASNVDNEKPGFTLMLLTGIDPGDPTKLRTSEDGTTATFSLALNSRPSDQVIITLTSSMPAEGVVSPAALIFTPDNWRSPQIISVKGVNDDVQDGSPLFYVTSGMAMSSDPGYALDPPDVQVTNTDNDSAGVSVELVKGVDPSNKNQLVTEEKGSTTATFTVKLTSQPTDDVTIPLSNSNPKESTLWSSSLTFTPLNYGSPQTVTISGVDDKIVDGNQPYVITVGAASSQDLNFDGKFMSQVQITNIDDDTPGVIVSPLSGLTTNEDGKSDSFTIRLQSQPTDDVTIGVSSNNPTEGKPNVSIVTFTAVNWNANQTIVVTGQDDDGQQDGDASYKIVLEPAQSKDPNYNGKPDPPDVTLINVDNDSAGFNVTPTSGLSTSEAGGKATFTVSLNSKPVNTANPGAAVNVKFSLSSSKPTEGTVSPTTLTFTDANWRSPQTVTITGIDDQVADGPQPYVITLSLASSTDQNYNAHKPSDVSVTNTDDDSARLIITPTPSLTPAITTEQSNGKSTFTVVLGSLPTADVTFTVTSLDTTEGTVSPATLKFTPSNGKTPQTVTVTGVNDDLADGDQQYTVRLSNGTSQDPNYGGKFGLDLPFVNVDEDQTGLVIDAPASLTTTENHAGTATFTVKLRSQPTDSVSIGVSSSNTGEGKVSPAMLVFTPDNWSSAQTVTITGVQDEVADGPQTYQVKLANASSADPKYDGKFATQLDVQNIDDDVPGYVVSADPMLQTTESGGTATFSVKLQSKPAGSTTVTLALTSTKLTEGSASPSTLVFSAADWDQPHTVTVTGVDDKKVDGPVSYQITFTPDASYSATVPAAVSLTNVDDDELGVLITQVTPAANCSTTPGTTSTFSIRLKSQPNANVTISLTSDTPTVGTVSPDTVTFTNSGTGSWETPQTVTVTGLSDGTMSMMTNYTIITSNASAPGETTGYDGFSAIADVSCTNTTPP